MIRFVLLRFDVHVVHESAIGAGRSSCRELICLELMMLLLSLMLFLLQWIGAVGIKCWIIVVVAQPGFQKCKTRGRLVGRDHVAGPPNGQEIKASLVSLDVAPHLLAAIDRPGPPVAVVFQLGKA